MVAREAHGARGLGGLVPALPGQLPVINRIAPKYPGVQVVTITTAQGNQPGPLPQDLVKKDHLTFPVAIDDAQQTLMHAMGVNAFPTLFFVRPDGTVFDQTSGEVTDVALETAFQALSQMAGGGTPSPAAPSPSPGKKT